MPAICEARFYTLLFLFLTRVRIEDERAVVPNLLEVEHVVIEPAMASNEPLPMRCPPSQLSSTKRITELWSVTLWSTKFFFAQGEITRKGSLGP